MKWKFAWGFRTESVGKGQVQQNAFHYWWAYLFKTEQENTHDYRKNASLSIISIKKYVVQLWSLLLTWQTYVANCAWVLYVLINHQWCKITGLYQQFDFKPIYRAEMRCGFRLSPTPLYTLYCGEYQNSS